MTFSRKASYSACITASQACRAAREGSGGQPSGCAVAHVDLVDEFVDHDVVALFGGTARRSPRRASSASPGRPPSLRRPALRRSDARRRARRSWCAARALRPGCTTMPTKSSYQSRPRCSTGSTACAAMASATASVITKPLAPWNSLVGQELRRQCPAAATRRRPDARRGRDSVPARHARARPGIGRPARALAQPAEHQASAMRRRPAAGQPQRLQPRRLRQRRPSRSARCAGPAPRT